MLNFIIFFLTLFEFRFSFLYILMIFFCFFFMIVSLFFVFVFSVFFSKFFHTSPLILVKSSLLLTDCNILYFVVFLPDKVYAFCILYMKTFPLQKFFATKTRVILNQFTFTFCHIHLILIRSSKMFLSIYIDFIICPVPFHSFA